MTYQIKAHYVYFNPEKFLCNWTSFIAPKGNHSLTTHTKTFKVVFRTLTQFNPEVPKILTERLP